jgi:hypothetical protein
VLRDQPALYGLRDYGVDGQIGLEETSAEFIAAAWLDGAAQMDVFHDSVPAA